MADSAWPAMPHSFDANHAAPCATVLGPQPLSHSASSADAQLQATAQCTKSFAASTAQTNMPCANTHGDLPDKAFQRSTACQEPQQAIPVWHKDDLSSEQFVQMFMQPNLPVMIQVSCMTGLCIGMELHAFAVLSFACPWVPGTTCADKPWELTHMQVECHSASPRHTPCPEWTCP